MATIIWINVKKSTVFRHVFLKKAINYWCWVSDVVIVNVNASSERSEGQVIDKMLLQHIENQL